MTNLLSSQYLFHRSLGPFQSSLAWYFLGLVLLWMIGALVFNVLAKKKDIFWQKSAKKMLSCAWVMGVVAIILWVFREISVLYLSAPILLLVWLIGAIIWFFSVLYYTIVTAPRRRKQLMSERSRKSYLP